MKVSISESLRPHQSLTSPQHFSDELMVILMNVIC